jgi:iron complex outermembrane recepter protein
LGADRLDLTANATWLLEYEQQVTPSAPWVRLGGLSGQPSRMRAQASASWKHGDLATTLGLNFVAGSHSLTGAQVHSWTTADLQFLFRPSSNAAVAKDLEIALSVRNIFDTDPPFYDAPQGIGYDPANADPLGRVVSLQAVKRW